VPFVVYNNDGVVRVLGTTFWLNDRDFSNYLTLVSGKVQFENHAQTILMQPNQRLSKVAGESQFEVKQANLRLLQTWKTNPFLLHNITMEDFADFLMNRYSVDILFINEDIKGCSITISIDGSETYQQLLTMAGMVNDFDFTEENGQIKVSGAGCSSLKNVRD
jgi:ferric-dicitrate binding protein FerR (iron transport regulator)